MRSARTIIPESAAESKLHAYDLLYLENDNPWDFWCLNYHDRLQKTLALIRKLNPPSDVLELGAAQANISLLLAEEGYECTAVELSPDFIAFSKKKYERGSMHWAQCNLFEFRSDQRFDVVILAEVIEHVAHPDQLLDHALGYIKPGGLLVITTPNGQALNNRLPLFSEISDFSQLEERQYGPEAADHLFAFTRKELEAVCKREGVLIQQAGYLSSLLLNTHTQFLLNIPFMGPAFSKMAFFLNHIPWARSRLGLHIYTVLQKSSARSAD